MSTSLHRLILVFFLISGITGLIYETIWMRSLALIFGSSFLALSTAFAAFLLGLGLGGFLLGPVADRVRNPVRLYVLLEVIIGIFALLSPLCFQGIGRLASWISLQFPLDFFSLSILRALLSIVALAIPTMAMGGTLPALASFLVRSGRDPGKSLGMLYGINTLGAAMGTVLAGFWLIESFTLFGALTISAGMSFLVAAWGACQFWNYCPFPTPPPVGAPSHSLPPQVEAPSHPLPPQVEAPSHSLPPQVEAPSHSLPPLRGEAPSHSLPPLRGEAGGGGGEITPKAQNEEEGAALSGYWLPVLAFFVGFISLLYEIAWSRVLHIMLGSYVYATSAVLASFLLGLAIGSLVLARRVATIADHAAFLGWAQLRIAFYVLLSIVLAIRLPGVYLFLYDISKQHFLSFQILQLAAVIVFTIIPTTLLGLSFPLICTMALRRGLPTGATLGRLYGLNSAGTVLGSLLSGFVLIPQIGAQAALTLGVFANGILGIVLLAKRKTPARRLAWVGGVILLFWLLVPPWDQRALAVGPYAYAYMVAGEKLQKVTFVEELSGRVRRGTDRASPKPATPAPQGRKRKSGGQGKEGKTPIGLASRSENFRVIYYKEGFASNIAVTEDEKGVRILTVNGKGDASNQFLDMSTQLLLGHLPLLHNPEARRVLVVGLGSGVTLGAIERYPVTDIHCVELESAVFQAARLFDEYHHTALSDPRVRITYEDARTVLARSQDPVDVIVSEPSNLWMGGVSNLFSQEHFLTCRKRLEPKGMLCQWVHLYQIAPEDFRTILATIRSVFPHLSIWVHNNSDALILASLSPQQLSELSRFPEAAKELTALGLPNREILIAHRMVTENRLEKYLEKARVHTDNNLILEFSAPRSLFTDRSQEILDILRGLR